METNLNISIPNIPYFYAIRDMYTQITNTNTNTSLGDERPFERMIVSSFYNNESQRSHLRRAALIAAMLHTRDITHGLGRYADFYTLVVAFDKVIDEKAQSVTRQKTETMRVILQKVLASCVYMNGYGSWKDMKYLLNRLRDTYGEDACSQKPIFKYIISMTSNQLKQDAQAARSGTAPTLAGKWAPREKSKKFGWQAKYYALYWNPEWCDGNLEVKDATTHALKKCLTHYRKQIAFINRMLQTPQIKQCAHDWASIDFANCVSRTTKEKQALAFKNITNRGELRRHHRFIQNDRMQCRANFLANESERSALQNASLNVSLYHDRYDWVWNDPLICHDF